MRGESLSVVIAVCTYRRPAGLTKLLAGLNAEADGVEASVTFLVVDNDPDISGDLTRAITAQAGGTYLPEVRKGLVNGRNSALEYAHSNGADSLIFIDDDEAPVDGWLAAYIDGMDSYPGEILCGPVKPVLAESAPDWSPDGSFWRRPTYVENEPVPAFVPDGNILYPRGVIERFRYDSQFNVSGGQDTELQKRMAAVGIVPRWLPGAAVWEYIPVERLTLQYAIEREYFSAFTYAKICKLDSNAQLQVTLRGVGHIVVGWYMRHIESVWAGRVSEAQGQLRMSRGKGMLNGLSAESTNDRYGSFQGDTASDLT